MAVVLYVISYLPNKILGGVYLVALLRAKRIDSKMKAILINNFVPDLLISISGFGFYALHPYRAYSAIDRSQSCSISFITIFIGQLSNTLAPPLFAVAVYVFVKYNIKKLKWSVIICYIVVSWSISLIGVVPLAVDYEDVIIVDGFCEYSPDSLADYIPFTLYVLGLVFCICVTILFDILNYCYVKSNSLSTSTDSPDPTKKALVKLLVFDVLKGCTLMLQIFVFLYAFLSPVSFGAVEGNVVSTVVFYLVSFFYGLTILLGPIVAVALLKPVRDALKQMFGLPCNCHLPHNRATPRSDQGNVEIELVERSQE